MGDDKSSHWKARLMLAKANKPSAGRSCSLFPMVSLTIHLEINDELLFAMLFFGFFFFPASLVIGTCRLEFPSPKAGAEPIESRPGVLPAREVRAPSLLLGGISPEVLPSLGCSFILE